MKRFKLEDRTYSVHRKIFYYIKDLENTIYTLNYDLRLCKKIIMSQDKLILKLKQELSNYDNG